MKKLLQKRNKKGFTLAELLIVVAILAILVAIMFPVFGAQLNKARAAADLANVRAAYSEAVADAMLSSDETDLTAAPPESINISITEDLQPACKYDSTVSYDNDNEAIVVTHESGISGSFKIDGDVTVS